ncbi:hypothetical protein QAD02_024158 [Eretmocerus hayati]|uniref:Uncharacterized protein n=1 Tax=Eretmocerus hayati TaxID=131215 RepID=A0ACC2PZH5_9HYME|nr:hypothetical protein QAD02_024158 [Eretmocerus hayati]
MNERPNTKKTRLEVADVLSSSSRNLDTNGLLVANNLIIPEEVLLHIFHFLDHGTLTICHLVCQRWESVVKNFVWRQKAEKVVGHNLASDEHYTSWMIYYSICIGTPFNKNLIRNHSGEKGLRADWRLPCIMGIKWQIESPPTPPLPSDPLFANGDHHCFVTSVGITWKYQIIDLTAEGFSTHLLDNLQPPIKVSEWYCCQEAPALYLSDIELLTSDEGKKLKFTYKAEDCTRVVTDHRTFSRIITHEDQNQWQKYEYEIKGYGRGLRKIKFIHGGKDKHIDCDENNRVLGTKMARACVKLQIPLLKRSAISH